jgi:Spy/CpxP family protein refolding chaperone
MGHRSASSARVHGVMRYLPAIGIAGLLLALAPPLRAQSFGFPWWRDAQFQRELTLTTEQSARIENVYQTAIPSLRQKKEDLDLQEEELSRLIANNADELVVTKQVDKVEAIRASLNKMRTLMLLHMRQVLMPDQRARLNKLHEQWLKDHARPKNEK